MRHQAQAAIDVHEAPRPGALLILSLQHLFAMFGATILVPFLTGLSPAVALVSSGLGTLAYLLITRGRIPAYLGSSFAFIAPIISASALGGPEGAMVGTFVAGLMYGVVALFISRLGVGWLLRVLPPVVVGPVIMVIGLGLAGVAVDMAMNDPATGAYSGVHFLTALVTLGVTVLCAIFLRGVFGLIPVLFGIVFGYLFAYALGLIDMMPVAEAAFFAVPPFIVPFVTYTPVLSWTVLMIIVPVALVTMAEHIGDQMVLSKVVGRNFLKTPGLHRSLFGDGFATMLASVLGGPPNTTYGENIGVLAITRVYSVYVIGGAAIIAVVFGFVGKLAAFIGTIPTAVMGGVSLLLFGIIASSGLRMLIDNRVDIGEKRNLIIASVILTIGVGGAFIRVSDDLQVAGMALATIVGVVLNQLLPGAEENAQVQAMFEEGVSRA